MSKTDPLESAPNDFCGNASNLYELLGVSHNASAEEIDEAYKQLVMKHHPDRSDRDDAEDITFALNNTIKIIGDKNERLLYEQLGHDAYFNQTSGAESPYNHANDETNDDTSVYEMIRMTELQSHIEPNQSLFRTVTRSSGFRVFIASIIFLAFVFIILLLL